MRGAAHDGRCAGHEVDRANPSRAPRRGRQAELLRPFRRVGRQCDLGQRQLEVRRAQVRVRVQRDGWRRVFRVADRIAAGHPGQQNVQLPGGQRLHVLEPAGCGVHAPRRHVSGDQLGPDRFSPGHGVLGGHQRHRRDAAGDVAAAAPIADDRKHIVVVGVGRRDRLVGLGVTTGQSEREDHERRDDSLFHVVDAT